MANPTDNLIKFDSTTAAEAGRKSGIKRRERKELEQAAKLGNAPQAREALDIAIATFTRDQLGPGALAAASTLIGRILTGDIIVRHAADASDLLRTLVDIGRLEGGEHTSLSVSMDAGAVAERIQALRARANEAGAPTQADTPTQHVEAIEAAIAETETTPHT